MNKNIEKEYIIKEGFDFRFNPLVCDYCGGRCCYGEHGYIWLNNTEIREIATFLNIKIETFISDYLRKENGKYTIKDIKFQNYYSCLFFDRVERLCSIYSVRPVQCRTFPFWDLYKEDSEPLFTECQGVEELNSER